MSTVPAPVCELAQALREALLEWLGTETQAPEVSLSEPPPSTTRQLTQQTIRWLNRHSQFVRIDAQSSQSMEDMHQDLLKRIALARSQIEDASGWSREVERIVEEHARRLVTLLQSLGLPTDLSSMPLRVCAEYSLSVQFRTLGIDAACLLEPVLDVGCGEAGSLVHHLRGLGKNAFGLDRVAPEGEGFCSGDWFDGQLQPGTWGTILSHQGFSVHFLHHHLRPGTQAERYALKYMEILRALRPGGSFVYAPGLPFIESFLPNDLYAVKRLSILELADGQYDQALRASFGSSVLYACHVQRAGQ